MNSLVRAVTAGGAAVALALAAGCGGGTVADPGSEETSSANSGPISVATAKGDVTLDEPATKVVSLEWSYTEELLALGVTPVGAADSEAYAEWVTAPGAQLPDDVTDVGSRQEPSIEKIKALDPDLIVSDVDRLTANFDQLNEIAPVVAFDPTEKPQLETMKTNFTELAEAVGKEGKAEEVLGELDSKVDEVTSTLDEAGESGGTFALAQGYTAEGAPGIRMFTSDTMAASLLESAGLENGWDGKPDSWGMTTVGVEGLTKVDSGASFLYVALKSDDPFTSVLKDNAAWQDLSFVKQDDVAALDPGTWLFGGPLSAMQLLDETAKAYSA
ncbi:ABC transporter substrate-binding protein [Haloechinothrix halophila]|uniref:ABC transporter substrate-binding protein n=1 Tax=Haloechinothrix halophila TaxID=1069073 RepID=UPI0003FEDFC0|nr:iron-siderophore ABC transporter substrate-binding protein [Haloechinothrix halophila]